MRKFGETEVPVAIQSNISKEEFLKSQAYQQDKLSFSLLTGYCSIIEQLFMVYFGLFPWAWDKVISLHGSESPIVQAIFFNLAMSLFNTISGVAFSAYSTFVIEERHGFNKMTLHTFITDKIKGFIIGAIIFSIVIAGLLYILEIGGEFFYVYVWAFVSVVIFILIAIYPNVIAPLFNEFKPLDDGKLKDQIEEMAKAQKFPLGRLFVIDGSKRSSHSNAYFYGLWNKQIVLFDTLLNEEIKNEEVLSILCHELGHWKYGHMMKNLVIMELQMFAMFYLFGQVVYNLSLYQSFGFNEITPFVGLMLFMLIYSPVSFLTNLVMVRLSRRFEFQADGYAKELGYAEQLIAGLVKIFTQNSGNLNPDPLYSEMNFSHPPLVERIAALQNKDTEEKKKD